MARLTGNKKFFQFDDKSDFPPINTDNLRPVSRWWKFTKGTNVRVEDELGNTWRGKVAGFESEQGGRSMYINTSGTYLWLNHGTNAASLKVEKV